MPIKEQIEGISWIKLAIEVLVLGGSLWALAAIVGDGRWANSKDTTRSFREIRETIIANQVRDDIHYHSEDLHMPSAVKEASFVSRREWQADKDSVAKALERQGAAFDQFATEQHRVNREILQRLPQKL